MDHESYDTAGVTTPLLQLSMLDNWIEGNLTAKAAVIKLQCHFSGIVLKVTMAIL